MSDLAAAAPATGFSGKRAYKLPRNLGRRLGRSDRSQLAIWFWELDRVLLSMIRDFCLSALHVADIDLFSLFISKG